MSEKKKIPIRVIRSVRVVLRPNLYDVLIKEGGSHFEAHKQIWIATKKWALLRQNKLCQKIVFAIAVGRTRWWQLRCHFFQKQNEGRRNNYTKTDWWSLLKTACSDLFIRRRWDFSAVSSSLALNLVATIYVHQMSFAQRSVLARLPHASDAYMESHL